MLVDGAEGVGTPPDPEVCPACSEQTHYVWFEGVWDLDGEWWHDRTLGIRYADTYRCLRALQTRAWAEISLRHRGCPLGTHQPSEPHDAWCWVEY